MVENLKGKYFVASRGLYGTNSVSYRNIEMEVTKYNHDYANPITNFEWGDTEKSSNLLAFAILNTIASPTVARIYANKYTESVIKNFKEDEWRMEAIEVAHWINANTEYTIELDNEEALEKEKRKIKREEEFKKQVQEKLAKRSIESQSTQKAEKTLTNNVVDNLCKELHIRNEALAKILDVPIDTINNWRLENEMPKLARKAIEFYKAGIAFKEKNSKLKIEANKFQEELIKNQTQMSLYETELNRYKKFINALDLPTLYKKYKEL